MREKNHSYISLFIILLLALVNIAIFSAIPAESASRDLKVVFLDVGQGDAIFIESPSGIQMLIDAGQTKKILEELSRVMSFDDRSIDVVLATHPDADHVGGLPFVFERYEVDVYVSTKKSAETATYKRVEESVVREEGLSHIYAERGMFFDLGAGVIVRVLYPDTQVDRMDANESSIIVQVDYGDVEFLLTGDAPISVENYLVSMDGGLLESEVLKIGHHGSRTSTGKSFLGVVSPKYAVVSVGEGNRYGHPHSEVISLVEEQGASVYSTADRGSIVFYSDGVILFME